MIHKKEKINLSVYHSSEVVEGYNNWNFVSEAEELALNFSKKANSKVLDVGCGTGRHSNFFKNLSVDYLGIDISCKMIESTDGNNLNIKFKLVDILDISNHDKFDTILFMHNGLDLFYPYSRRKLVLKKIASILKTDGKFIFSTHIPDWYPNQLKESTSGFKNLSVRILKRLFRSEKGYLPENYNGITIWLYRASVRAIQKEMETFGFSTEIIIPDYSKSPYDWNYYVCSLKKSAANK